jgi:chromate reductase, NAD(P)H dehydrogenase (quinone)
MKICIVVASEGKNLELAHKFEMYLQSQSVDVNILELVDLNLPLYTSRAETEYQAHELINPIKTRLAADGFIILAPEYNGGPPPVFSNFLSWVSRSTKDWRETFNEKPVVIGTFSGGPGSNVLSIMRLQLSYLGMNVLGRQISVHSKKELDEASLKAVCDQLTRVSSSHSL